MTLTNNIGLTHGADDGRGATNPPASCGLANNADPGLCHPVVSTSAKSVDADPGLEFPPDCIPGADSEVPDCMPKAILRIVCPELVMCSGAFLPSKYFVNASTMVSPPLTS